MSNARLRSGIPAPLGRSSRLPGHGQPRPSIDAGRSFDAQVCAQAENHPLIPVSRSACGHNHRRIGRPTTGQQPPVTSE